MNYNIRNLDDPASTFASRFPMLLWYYTVVPRVEGDPPYIVELDFAVDPLNAFVNYYQPIAGDTLEAFILDKRVLLTGAEVSILEPAPGLHIRIVTNSGIVFDTIDCSVRSTHLYAIDGGIVDRATDLRVHSRLIEYPDYLGIEIVNGSVHLPNLAIRIQLAVSDEFEWTATPNYEKV